MISYVDAKTDPYPVRERSDGPLFRGRYKSILLDEDAYLLQVSRYIHRNPLEVKGRPKEQKYSSWSK